MPAPMSTSTMGTPSRRYVTPPAITTVAAVTSSPLDRLTMRLAPSARGPPARRAITNSAPSCSAWRLALGEVSPHRNQRNGRATTRSVTMHPLFPVPWHFRGLPRVERLHGPNGCYRGAMSQRMLAAMSPQIATNTRVDRAGLLEFARPRHRAILLTARVAGTVQASPVTCGVDREGHVVISTYPERAKAANIRRA